jgi:cysteinyl-tRNA synthetase
VLHLHDTASGQLQPLVPRDPGSVAMYVCGPTVYGPPHVGHGRFMLVYDVLRRYLEYAGFAVDHVSNVTDIDDKILQRAASEGRAWEAIAEESEGEWWRAMDALGIARPTVVPHATEYIAEMEEMIGALVTAGAAYTTGDGVYLSVGAVPEYGLLAHQRPEDRIAGARVGIDEEKRAPADFALWKRTKPGEPSWASRFGAGRPGWHTECVAMALSLLGEGFDLHGGGLDLVFPHHENERAQAVQLGRAFSRLWVHNGLVTAGGEKMSKSLGNVLDLQRLVDGADPRAYRLLVLRARYRSPLEVRPELLEDAARGLQRVDALARRLEDVPSGSGFPEVEELEARFVAAMEDDLDTPAATATLFEGVRRANSLLDDAEGAAGGALGRKVVDLFGALGVGPALGVTRTATTDPWATDLAERRDRARADRDFAAADALRSELEAAGWSVEDTPGGTRIHR